MEKIQIVNKQQLVDAFKSVDQYLQDYQSIILMWDKDSRSIPQNALFHMWCTEFADFLTMKGRPANKDEAKYWLKSKFLGFEDITIGKDVIPAQLRRTSKLTVGEMYHFMEQVWEYCSSTFGLFLTVPQHSQFAQIRAKQNE